MNKKLSKTKLSLKGINKKLHLDVNLERKKSPTRSGFGEGLLEAGKKNKKVVALSADLSDSTKVTLFKKKFPERFIQIGVAEQNLVTVGSGFAAAGKIPFVTSYAVFSPGRCWEQIRTTICYNDQPVKIIGSHSGVSVGPDGATHQALEDIALTRVLPNMTVIVPMDHEQAKKATLAIAKTKHPCYLRLTRNKNIQFTTNKTPFSIGKAQILKNGTDLAIIGAGPIVSEALIAAEVLQMKGINVQVINCHTIKPLDVKTIVNAAKKCGKVMTVEEHQIDGGLGGAICETLSEKYPVPVKRIGMNNQFGESGDGDELLEHFGLTSKNIIKKALKFVKIGK